MIGLVEHERPHVAANLRRLMAQLGLTNHDVARRSGLDLRTIKSILAGRRHPHPRTLHRLAAGLAVEADELFQTPELLARRHFDRWTNPVVEEYIAAHPQLTAGWSAADFEELYSRFGTGGALTSEGARAAIEAANAKRRLRAKIDLLLETDQADVLQALVETLYQKVVIVDGAQTPPPSDRSPR